MASRYRHVSLSPHHLGRGNQLVCNFIVITSAGNGTFSEILILTREKEVLYEFLQLKSPQIQFLEGL